MNDSTGLIYDDDAAIATCVKLTGRPEEIVCRVLAAKDLLLVALGIMADDCAPEGVDLAALRAKHGVTRSDRTARSVTYDREAMFIAVETGIELAVVVEVMAADTEYQARVGIVDRAAVDGYRAWVPGFLKSQKEGA